MADHIESLIKRLESGECSNELDIAIQIATFDPDVSVRANDAGTKVIYTKSSGRQVTHWAYDHSQGGANRVMALAALKQAQATLAKQKGEIA